MAEAAPWKIAIRFETAHRFSRKGFPRGWALTEHRGFAGLNITAKAGGGKRRQINYRSPGASITPKRLARPFAESMAISAAE